MKIQKTMQDVANMLKYQSNDVNRMAPTGRISKVELAAAVEHGMTELQNAFMFGNDKAPKTDAELSKWRGALVTTIDEARAAHSITAPALARARELLGKDLDGLSGTLADLEAWVKATDFEPGMTLFMEERGKVRQAAETQRA